jgi:hypothetical protein
MLEAQAFCEVSTITAFLFVPRGHFKQWNVLEDVQELMCSAI